MALTLPVVVELHKAFLRYHDPDNWPLLRDALKRMGRADLIGNGKRHLVPAWQPRGTAASAETGRRFRTQHTGLPVDAASPGGRGRNTSRPKKQRSRRSRPVRP